LRCSRPFKGETLPKKKENFVQITIWVLEFPHPKRAYLLVGLGVLTLKCKNCNPCICATVGNLARGFAVKDTEN
jgi:hypothetical protein